MDGRDKNIQGVMLIIIICESTLKGVFYVLIIAP